MKKQHTKKAGRREPEPPRPIPANVGKASTVLTWRRLLIPLLCLAASGAGTYFVLTTYVFAKLPESIVGVWRVEGGEMHGARMTFHRDGAFTAKVRLDDGREVLVDARVELRNKTLRFTYANPATGKDDVKNQTIRSLTPTEMVVDEGGGAAKLVRVE